MKVDQETQTLITSVKSVKKPIADDIFKKDFVPLLNKESITSLEPSETVFIFFIQVFF